MLIYTTKSRVKASEREAKRAVNLVNLSVRQCCCCGWLLKDHARASERIL